MIQYLQIKTIKSVGRYFGSSLKLNLIK